MRLSKAASIVSMGRGSSGESSNGEATELLALSDFASRGSSNKIAVDWDAIAWSYLDALVLHPDCTPEAREKLLPSACDHWNRPVELLGLSTPME